MSEFITCMVVSFVNLKPFFSIFLCSLYYFNMKIRLVACYNLKVISLTYLLNLFILNGCWLFMLCIS